MGHQTRLESKGTANCPLIFCTTGVFLRSLIESDCCLKGITHVIIDQVHERDRFTDLLLGVFRLRLSQYPDLRLILLSANMAPHALANYFHQEKIIKIPVPSHPVSELFLEDILTCTKFLSKQRILVGAGGVQDELTMGPATAFDELITEVCPYCNFFSLFWLNLLLFHVGVVQWFRLDFFAHFETRTRWCHAHRLPALPDGHHAADGKRKSWKTRYC